MTFHLLPLARVIQQRTSRTGATIFFFFFFKLKHTDVFFLCNKKSRTRQLQLPVSLHLFSDATDFFFLALLSLVCFLYPQACCLLIAKWLLHLQASHPYWRQKEREAFLEMEKSFLKTPTAYLQTWPPLPAKEARKLGVENYSPLSLILEVPSHCFCCVIFITSKSVKSSPSPREEDYTKAWILGGRGSFWRSHLKGLKARRLDNSIQAKKTCPKSSWGSILEFQVAFSFFFLVADSLTGPAVLHSVAGSRKSLP